MDSKKEQEIRRALDDLFEEGRKHGLGEAGSGLHEPYVRPTKKEIIDVALGKIAIAMEDE